MKQTKPGPDPAHGNFRVNQVTLPVFPGAPLTEASRIHCFHCWTHLWALSAYLAGSPIYHVFQNHSAQGESVAYESQLCPLCITFLSFSRPQAHDLILIFRALLHFEIQLTKLLYSTNSFPKCCAIQGGKLENGRSECTMISQSKFTDESKKQKHNSYYRGDDLPRGSGFTIMQSRRRPV